MAEDSGNERKKMVLKASVGQANASDQTHMEAPGKGDGEISDPMSMRDTDTGSMKKVPVADETTSFQKQTIKLKPLGAKKDVSASSTGPVEPAEQPVDDATSKLRKPIGITLKAGGSTVNSADATEPPASSIGEDTGESVDEVTQKLARPAKSSEAKPLPIHEPMADPEEEDEMSTRDTQNLKHEPLDMSASRPVVPGSNQTIKLRPATGSAPGGTATSTAPKGTIKLKPAGGGDNTDTAPAPKSKNTIKLTPQSAGATASPSVKPSDPTTKGEGVSEDDGKPRGKTTIKLSPAGAQGTQKSIARPSPSSPTLKLGAGSGGGAPKPGDPTVRFSAEEDEGGGGEVGEKTVKLGLKQREAAAASPQEQRAVGASPAKQKTQDEPSVLFTVFYVGSIAACGYFLFNIITQLQLLNR